MTLRCSYKIRKHAIGVDVQKDSSPPTLPTPARNGHLSQEETGMTQAFDEIMKRLESTGAVSDEEAQKLIAEHGPLTNEEKQRLAEALKEAGSKGEDKTAGEKPPEPDAGAEAEVTMEEYLAALATLDSSDVTDEEKARATRVKERFENP
jgi:hypothetical protein